MANKRAISMKKKLMLIFVLVLAIFVVKIYFAA